MQDWVSACIADPLTRNTPSGDPETCVIGTLAPVVWDGTAVPGFAMRAFRMGSGPLHMVLTGCVHPCEAPAFWAMQAVVDWLRSGSPAATAFLARFTASVYPECNLQGAWAARTRVTASNVDMNREFDTDPDPAKAILRAALDADLSTVHVLIDFHGTRGLGGATFRDIWRRTSQSEAGALAAFDAAMAARGPYTPVVSAGTLQTSINGWVSGRYTAPVGLYLIYEARANRNVGPADWAAFGVDTIEAIDAIRATVWPEAPPGPAPAAIPDNGFAALQNGTIRLYADAPAGASDVQYQVDGAGDWIGLGATARGDYATAVPPNSTIRLRSWNGAGSTPTAARRVGDQFWWVPDGVANLTSRFVPATPVFDAGPPPWAQMADFGSDAFNRRAISVDSAGGVAIPAAARVNFYTEYLFAGTTDHNEMGVVLRGAGGATTATGWAFRHGWTSTGANRIIIAAYDGGTFGFNQQVNPFATAADLRYAMAGFADGNAKAFKVWPAAGAEPGTWGINIMDPSVAGAGWIGLWTNNRRHARVYCLGVGLNGAPAPRPLT
jgi:hypothetical protein